MLSPYRLGYGPSELKKYIYIYIFTPLSLAELCDVRSVREQDNSRTR